MFDFLGRLAVRLAWRYLRIRYRRQLRVGIGIGVGALVVGAVAYLSARGAPEG